MFLEIKGLTKYFAGLAAITDLDMHVDKGEVVGLIGPNGAGKTTLFNLITGFLRPTKGKVLFEEKDVTGKPPHVIAKLGIGRTFQLVPHFPEFTTLQNVMASFHVYPVSSLWDTFWNTATYRKNEQYILGKSIEILSLVGLDHVRDELSKNLPHGYQKMLSIARALAVSPKLLLLDEPIAGMNPDEIDFTMKAISKTNERGVTILLVEHNMQIMNLCDRIVVINFGHKIAEGSLAEVRANLEVNKAYFGDDDGA
ncbi:MAG: ABC transporter ATP-binding protein [Syntrophorhabdales bacterium]|jgi:branched-chain amino acid transport system ATP-binding protein